MWRAYSACIHKSASWTWCSFMSPFFTLATACCSSFIDSVHVALLPPIIYLSFPFISRVFWFEALRRGSRKIHHTWRTQKKELLYAELCIWSNIMLHIHIQCIHHFYMLAHMWYSAFFHLSYCHCRIHLKPISFGVYTLASHSRNIDHKKAVLHSTPFFYMYHPW